MHLIKRSVVKSARPHLEFDDEDKASSKYHHIRPFAHTRYGEFKVNATGKDAD